MSSKVREYFNGNDPLKHSGLFGLMSGLPLWYNGGLTTPSVPQALRQYTTGTKYLSTKQVPSCLILRCAGSSSIRRNCDDLLRSGFTLSEQDLSNKDERRDLTVRRLTENLMSPVGTLAEVLTEASQLADAAHMNMDEGVDSDCENSGSEHGIIPEVIHENTRGKHIRLRKTSSYRIKYDDPWKIHAGYRLGEIRGESPDIVVWSGDVIRLQDPLPPRLLGPEWMKSTKSKVRFEDLRDKSARLHLIYRHTHWGKRLRELCNEPGPYRTWARRLRYRVNRYLSGMTDPEMPPDVVKALFQSTKTDVRARSLRLIEMLKTVDGIFLQRYLCYPEEVWTWQRFDMFTLGNIACLLGDEFLDGVMTREALSINTSYAQLKQARKWFKKVSLRSTSLENTFDDLSGISHWCRQFVNVWKRVNCFAGPRRDYLIGVLAQTRGAGTPPPLVLLQSKDKFLSSITLEPEPESATYRALRVRALGEVLDALPQEAFTGLATKARVTVSTSSSWEKTRREGGTIEAAREILASLPVGEQVPVRDLDTNAIQFYRSVEDFESIGEAVFWLALDWTLRTPLRQLTTAFLTMVKEPGKARTVTKARACLKIVLDLVNKLCSSPLEKGIRSSASGMGKANHGWNLFCRLMSDEVRDMVFCTESREENPYEGYVERTDTFKHLFISSTDYKEATDRLQHDVAKDLGEAWMRKCGIPRVLRGIVNKTCFKPRQVFFRALGGLEDHGQAHPELGEDIRSVRLVSGVLMGDPLTKPILHLVNVVNRQLGERLFRADFYEPFHNAREAHETIIYGIQ